MFDMEEKRCSTEDHEHAIAGDFYEEMEDTKNPSKDFWGKLICDFQCRSMEP
jgi:hypothetical protein